MFSIVIKYRKIKNYFLSFRQSIFYFIQLQLINNCDIIFEFVLLTIIYIYYFIILIYFFCKYLYIDLPYLLNFLYN